MKASKDTVDARLSNEQKRCEWLKKCWIFNKRSSFECPHINLMYKKQVVKEYIRNVTGIFKALCNKLNKE